MKKQKKSRVGGDRTRQKKDVYKTQVHSTQKTADCQTNKSKKNKQGIAPDITLFDETILKNYNTMINVYRTVYRNG